jgi:apolipoprotein D and lipocalin family protein
MKKFLFTLLSLLIAGCLGYPETVKPVTHFELQSYLGKWYEIARLDHKFERGMDNVTAEYSLQDGGGVKVINRGFLKEKGKWEEAIGKAYFVEQDNIGYFKVSFFGPFYGSYVIFELDPKEYSFVCGSNASYLWLLSRKPSISEELKNKFVKKVEELGFDSSKLIWVNQAKNDA